jgi:hypothetical protein
MADQCDRETVTAAIAEERWVHTVKRGARLLFWAAILSYAVGNLIAFSLPFLGGTLQDLRRLAPLFIAGTFVMAIAVFLITAQEPGLVNFSRIDARVVRTFAILEAIATAATRSFNRNIAYAENILYWLAVLTLLLYIRTLSLRFGLKRLAWAAGALAWLFPITSIALPLIPKHVWTSFPANLLAIGLELFVGMWTLLLIWKFGNKIATASQGKCLHCGYSLMTLSESRCSECGTPFSRDWQLGGTA